MANGDPLAVHDVTVADYSTFNRTGGVERGTQVTFYVGTHGPFTRQYPAGSGTSDQINSDIQHQVTELRRIAGAGGQ